jgi:Icc protein
MLVAQISDLHVRPKGELYQGVVDSNRMLGDAIDHLHRMDRQADLLLVTGDLVDEGRPDEYLAVRDLLGRSRIPFLVIPGNHDNRDFLREAFADHKYLPAQGPLHYCVDDHPVRIVALDSSVPGQHHGAIDDAGLRWLHTTLSNDPDKPTLIMIHHPPFLCGIPYMDTYRLVDASPLEAIVSSVTNVEVVVCGHVHRPMLKRWGGTIVCSCPSTTTEIALQLSPDAKAQSYLGPPACMLHLWTQSHGMISHLSHIGDYPGPYPFA